MKKIWDAQNNQPLYVLDEHALHKTVKSKMNRARRLVSINEIGLIVINLIVATKNWIEVAQGKADWYDLAIAIIMTSIIGYILYLRTNRLKNERTFDRSILGELDHAISSTTSLIGISRSIYYWYMLPMGVTIMIKFILNGTDLSKWLIIIAMFGLSFFLIRLELNKCHLPRKRKLEDLRAKLLEEV